jgi:cation transport ATPase
MVLIALGIIKVIKLNPMLASIAMMLSSLTVILNALRLKRIKLERK